MLPRRLLRKARGAEWKTHYRLKIEIGLSLSLLVVTLLFRLPLTPGATQFDVDLGQQEVVQIEEIQQTHQQMAPPPPPRPPVPIEVPDDEVIEDVELDLDVTLDIGEATLQMPPPPPVQEEEEEAAAEEEIFIVVEEMPEIVGGTQRLYELLEYPIVARQAQIEGLVIVQVVVEPDGSGSGHEVLRSAGSILDDAAVAAVKQLAFTPGRQRTKPVRVRLAIPIRFQLRGR